jgi:hypothetical protein
MHIIPFLRFRRIILFLSCIFISLQLFSQDSLSVIPARKNTCKPAFDFDQRFSFITKREVNIWGVRAGLLVNEKFKVGIGTYYSNGKLESYTIDSTGSTSYNGKRNLYFGTVYFEPFIFRFRFIEFSVPFELGAGKSVFRVYNDINGNQVSRIANYFIPTGAGLSLSLKLPPIGRFKPTRWFGINFLAGYRYCAFQGKLENIFPHRFETDYNGLFWSVSGAIFLDRFSDDCKEWHKKRQTIKAQNRIFY